MRDHYKPLGPSDSVPIAPVTVAVALADKLDTLVGFFAIDERPTGSKDPYALRRAALGVIRLIGNSWRTAYALTNVLFRYLSRWLRQLKERPFVVNVDRYRVDPKGRYLVTFVIESWGNPAFGYLGVPDNLFDDMLNKPSHWMDQHQNSEADAKLLVRADDLVQHINAEKLDESSRLGAWVSYLSRDLLAFFADRLKVLLREEGKRHDLVDAVFALGDDDLVRIVRRVEALSAFLATEDGASLLAGYKRAANILRAEAKKTPDEDFVLNPQLGAMEAPEEMALQTTLATVQGQVAQALEREDYAHAMQVFSHLRAPVDAFFEHVLVNAPEPALRLNRLRLLSGVRDTANRIADFSLVGGG